MRNVKARWVWWHFRYLNQSSIFFKCIFFIHYESLNFLLAIRLLYPFFRWDSLVSFVLGVFAHYTGYHTVVFNKTWLPWVVFLVVSGEVQTLLVHSIRDTASRRDILFVFRICAFNVAWLYCGLFGQRRANTSVSVVPSSHVNYFSRADLEPFSPLSFVGPVIHWSLDLLD